MRAHTFLAISTAMLCNVFATSAAAAAPGSPDPSFGSGGSALTQLGSGSNPSSFGASVARQPDGKVVIAGRATDPDGNDQATVTRLDPSGSVDTSFGSGGSFKVQLGAGAFTYSSADAVSLQRDGKIVIAGTANDAGSNRVFVLRLTADGSLDSGFASSGVYLNQFGDPATPSSSAFGAAIQPDGKIVVAGSASDAIGQDQVLVARLTSSGALDSAFGAGGAYINQFAIGGAPNSGANAVALLPDGRIVIGGGTFDFSASTGQALVARLTSSGSLDHSFGSDGAFLGQFSSATTPSTYANALAIQPDGRIVIAGDAGDGAAHSSELLVARLSPSGTVDTSFGSGGAYRAQFAAGGSPQSRANAVAIQPDGKILVGGSPSIASGFSQVLVARLNASGNLDTGFGSSGIILGQIGAGTDPQAGVNGLALQPDGKIILAGFASDATGHVNVLAARLLGNPGPRAAFGHSPLRARVGVRTAFDARGSVDPYDPIVAYAWNFGDGTTGAGRTPTHTYKRPGAYTVTLATLDADGLYSLATHRITTAKPAITRATEAHKTWREGKKAARISTPVGTTFTIGLNEKARLTLVFKQGKHKRGTLTLSAHPGTNRISFYGRLSRKRKLPTGKYTLTITAASGKQLASARTLSFTILP